MSEKVSNEPVFYTKDFSGYGNEEDNFVTNQELTVTITLNEYRRLIGSEAKHSADRSELQNQLWKSQHEVEDLKERVMALTKPQTEVEEDGAE